MRLMANGMKCDSCPVLSSAIRYKDMRLLQGRRIEAVSPQNTSAVRR